MKTTKLTILLIIFSLLTSCTLVREDYGRLEEEAFLKTDRDLETALAGLYIIMGGPHGGWVNGNVWGAVNFGDLITDVMVAQGADWLYNHMYSPTRCTGGDLGDKFALVKELTKCRAFILRVENSNASETKKNQVIAEAKTIRAYIALHLYTYIGTVPVVPDEYILDPQNVKYFPRMEKGEYIKMIHDDINSALPHLKSPKEQNLESESGRMNKAIAYMVLLKLSMIERDWDSVQKYAKLIMDFNYYELQTSYEEIFAIANKRNSEVIYGVPRDAKVPNSGNTWHALTLPGLLPTPVPMAKWQGYILRWSFVDTFNPNDKRLNVVIQEFVGDDGITYNRQNTAPGVFERGAIPKKYDFDPNHIAQNSNHDIIRFRYADVLLSISEAINEIEGPTEEAYGYINQIRHRAGLNSLQKGLSKNEFRDSLLIERAHEFFAEGSRYPDLVRQKKFIEVARKNPNSAIKDDQILWPIPQKYIIEYGGVLVQNPGY